jgi:hypothetical protein
MNDKHPGIVYWLEFSKRWREQARANTLSVPLGKWVARYEDAFDMDILLLAGGTWLYNEFHHKPKLLREPVAAYRQIGRWVCLYWPTGGHKDPFNPLKLRTGEARMATDWFHRHMGPLLAGFVEAIKQRDAEVERVKALLSAPLQFMPKEECPNAILSRTKEEADVEATLPEA